MHIRKKCTHHHEKLTLAGCSKRIQAYQVHFKFLLADHSPRTTGPVYCAASTMLVNVHADNISPRSICYLSSQASIITTEAVHTVADKFGKKRTAINKTYQSRTHSARIRVIIKSLFESLSTPYIRKISLKSEEIMYIFIVFYKNSTLPADCVDKEISHSNLMITGYQWDTLDVVTFLSTLNIIPSRSVCVTFEELLILQRCYEEMSLKIR